MSNIPTNISSDEFLNYYLDQADKNEITIRFEYFSEKLKEKDKEIESLNDTCDKINEMNNNAMQLLEEIKEAIIKNGTKKELVKAIELLFEDSYVEL